MRPARQRKEGKRNFLLSFFPLTPCAKKKKIDSTYLPAFLGDVRVWFAQLESYFAANDISSEHRQQHITFSAFKASLISTIKNIITKPPPGSTYERVKHEVLLRTSLSAEKRFQTLVNDEHLGDRKPSQLLRCMRELVKNAHADSTRNNFSFQCYHRTFRKILRLW